MYTVSRETNPIIFTDVLVAVLTGQSLACVILVLPFFGKFRKGDPRMNKLPAAQPRVYLGPYDHLESCEVCTKNHEDQHINNETLFDYNAIESLGMLYISIILSHLIRNNPLIIYIHT